MMKYRHVSGGNVFMLNQEVNRLARIGYVCDGPIVVTVVSLEKFIYTQRMKKIISKVKK